MGYRSTMSSSNLLCPEWNIFWARTLLFTLEKLLLMSASLSKTGWSGVGESFQSALGHHVRAASRHYKVNMYRTWRPILVNLNLLWHSRWYLSQRKRTLCFVGIVGTQDWLSPLKRSSIAPNTSRTSLTNLLLLNQKIRVLIQTYGKAYWKRSDLQCSTQCDMKCSEAH